jgi:hypothetical protein
MVAPLLSALMFVEETYCAVSRDVPRYAKSSAWRTALRLSDVGDGTETRKVAVEYQIGHHRRHHD